MQTVGNYLKSGREAKNISLGEIARTTKISKWYLDCLEQDEFEKIPGGPYIKGYISSYAAVIGIEEDKVLECYDSLQLKITDDNQTQSDLQNVQKSRTLARLPLYRKKAIILSLAILLIIFAGTYLFWPQNQGQTRSPASSSNSISMPVPNLDAAKAENQTSVLAPSLQHAQNTKPQDVPKDKDSLRETGNYIEEAPQGEKPALATFPPPEQQASQAVVLGDAGNASGRNPGGTAGRDPENVAGMGTRTTIQDSESVSGLNDKGTAGKEQELAAAGGQTELSPKPSFGDTKVVEAVACSGVANRTPVGAGESFKWTMDKVYIWSAIESASYPSSIRHTYFFKGQKVGDVELEIRSSLWRTWSFKTLLDKRYIGPWRVDISSAEGNLLNSIRFDVN